MSIHDSHTRCCGVMLLRVRASSSLRSRQMHVLERQLAILILSQHTRAEVTPLFGAQQNPALGHQRPHARLDPSNYISAHLCGFGISKTSALTLPSCGSDSVACTGCAPRA